MSDEAAPRGMDIRGVRLLPGWLDAGAQAALAEDVRDIIRDAPLVTHVTRFGRPMSVRMTAAGRFGWVVDRGRYGYAERHPSGVAWPPIPDRVLALWRAVVPGARDPECCLVNWYGPEARMGQHQDRDEADLAQPVVSVSLGDDGRFRVGNHERGGPTEAVWLRSGDVAVLEGDGRLRFHGVDRIAPGTSTLLGAPGRVNLTLRVVT